MTEHPFHAIAPELHQGTYTKSNGLAARILYLSH